MRPLTLEHFEAYTSLMVLDTGRPAVWEPWQLEVFADAFAEDPGTRELWAVVPEGSGKTTMLACLALYHADAVDEASVPIAARDRDQANLLLKVAGGIVRRSPGMASRFQTRVHGLRVIRAVRTQGEVKVYAQGEGGDGVIPTLAILDELHLHPSLELYATWRGKLGKRDGQLLVISTAGEPDGEFEAARARAVENAEDVQRDGAHTRSVRGRVVVHDWALPAGANPMDVDEVLAAQASERVTRDDLLDKLDAPGFRKSSWLRRTCNRPAREHETPVSEKEWAACAVAGCRVPADSPGVVIGADLAFRGDHTGVVLVGHGTGDLDGRIVVDADVADVAPPGEGTSTRLEDVLAPFVRLALPLINTPVVDVTMDPSRDGEMVAQALEDPEMLARLLGMPDEQARALPRFQVAVVAQKIPALVRMTSRTMEAIRDRRLAHPDNPTLTRHLMAGTLKTLPLGDQRFDRPNRGARQPVDCATALLHAVDGLIARGAARSVYETRGVIVL
ncbi:MAG: terminase large subunit domain-containing protein [Solirubrobacteraceae bacterium]